MHLAIPVLVSLSVRLCCATRPSIWSDGDGNIHIDVDDNRTVFLGDVDVTQLMKDNKDTQAQLDTLWSLFPFRPEIYVVGGHDGTVLSRVESFDGQQWSLAPNVLTGRRHISCVQYGKGLYVIGGYPSSQTSPVNTVEMFNGMVWISAASLPQARGETGVTVYEESLYVIGGGQGSGPHRDVFVFDGWAWASGPALPEARHSVAAVTYRDHIYAIGGIISPPSQTNTVLVFDGVSWEVGMPLQTAREDHAAVVFDDKIYVIGGLSQSDVLSSVEVFDGNTWSSGPDLPTARFFLAAVVFQGKIYAVGGWTGNELETGVVEVFDGISWQQGFPPLPTARGQLCAAVFPPEDVWKRD